MKNNGITTILNWALIAGTAALVICGIKFYNKSKTVRTYQVLIGQARTLMESENLLKALLAESVEYGKTNPAINPLLDSIMKQPKTGPAPAATKPAAK